MATDSPAIEIHGLSKRYGDRYAVDDVYLSVPRGEVFGFVGPNGAGKSTTIKILMGLTGATAGRARVLGMEVSQRAPGLSRRVGYVPEFHSIYPWMRVDEVIRFSRSFYETWNDGLCAELLSLFGLRHDQAVGGLSKGTLAKLGLLLATSHEPELLIMDEPMAGLDPLVREEFMDGVLAGICRRPQTVLLSSHSLGELQQVAHSVGILVEGQLVVHEATNRLLADTKRVQVVLSEAYSALPGEGLPHGTLWCQGRGRAWQLTVCPFSPDTTQQLRQRLPVERLEIMDLDLEQIFKDVVRGRRQAT